MLVLSRGMAAKEWQKGTVLLDSQEGNIAHIKTDSEDTNKRYGERFVDRTLSRDSSLSEHFAEREL